MDSERTRHENISNIVIELMKMEAADRPLHMCRLCGRDGPLLDEVRKVLKHMENDSGTFNEPLLSDEARRRLYDEAMRPPQSGYADAGHDTEETESEIPEKIGQYRVLRVLGKGGMGVVYLAEQQTPKRLVALKVIQAKFPARRALSLVEREADAMGRLQHANIAQIFEAFVATEGGLSQPHIAMEYVEGKNLRDHAAAAALGTQERLELFVKVCSAVQHAHQNGLIHQDLKPENILVDKHGEPKVVDFGVARLNQSDAGHTREKTFALYVYGTPEYMSPEQIGGRPQDIDTRADVYALGGILYELLAGRRPHDLAGLSQNEAIQRIRTAQSPRLGVANRRFHRSDLEAIAAKALSLDKEQRYSSASELAEDVKRFLNREPIAARLPSRAYRIRMFTRRHRYFVASTAVTFAALVAGVVGFAGQSWTAKRAAEKANKMLGLLQTILVQADPWRAWKDKTSVTIEAAVDRVSVRARTVID